MKILGIDPGLRITGYALLESSEDLELKVLCIGEIQTKLGENHRYVNIFKGISDLLSVYQPDLCAIERTFVNSNPFSSLQLGQARGVAILCFELFNKEYMEIFPNTIKKYTIGIGTGKKVDIQKYINSLVGLDLTSDSADALAIAMTALIKTTENITL